MSNLNSQSLDIASNLEHDYYQAINKVISDLYGADKNADIGDDLSKLNMTSLAVIKFITRVSTETSTEFPNIVDVVNSKCLASKFAYAKYLLKAQL